MHKNSILHSFLLLLAALIWGSAFVAQSVGMDYIGPFTFSAVRNTIGFIVLIPISMVNRRIQSKISEKSFKKNRTTYIVKTIKGGIVCGVILCASSNFQQVGILYTSVGKAGFLTALYVVFVPLFGMFLRKFPGYKTWISVIFAVIGLYLLCMTGTDISLRFGDILELICAVLFALHILCVDYFIDDVDGVLLSCIQFLVTAVISTVLMFVFEKPQISAICMSWLPIMYAGVLSSGVAFTLQIITQRHLSPVVAALIMSMESVFSLLSGWIILGERLSMREILGCIVMFAAIILAQIPDKSKKMLDSA